MYRDTKRYPVEVSLARASRTGIWQTREKTVVKYNSRGSPHPTRLRIPLPSSTLGLDLSLVGTPALLEKSPLKNYILSVRKFRTLPISVGILVHETPQTSNPGKSQTTLVLMRTAGNVGLDALTRTAQQFMHLQHIPLPARTGPRSLYESATRHNTYHPRDNTSELKHLLSTI